MTKAELQAMYDAVWADNNRQMAEILNLREKCRMYERFMSLAEALARRNTNYWSGS